MVFWICCNWGCHCLSYWVGIVPPVSLLPCLSLVHARGSVDGMSSVVSACAKPRSESGTRTGLETKSNRATAKTGFSAQDEVSAASGWVYVRAVVYLEPPYPGLEPCSPLQLLILIEQLHELKNLQSLWYKQPLDECLQVHQHT